MYHLDSDHNSFVYTYIRPFLIVFLVDIKQSNSKLNQNHLLKNHNLQTVTL